MAAEGAEEVRAKQAGGKEGGNGGQLSHSTWHVRGASPASRANGASARAGVTQQNRPPSAPTSPGSASKKSGFNMKGLLKSVSTHSFGRRSLGGHASTRKNMQLEQKGFSLEKEGKLQQAELMYSRHCLRSQRHHGKESLPLADDLDRLVHLLHREGKLEEAETLCRRALEIRRKSLGEENEAVATALVNLGRVLEEKSQYGNALVHLKKGLAIREKILEEGHPDTVSALAWIGDIHSKREEYGEALLIAKKVVQAHEAKLGPRDIKVASALNNMAGLLASTGKTEEALPLFTRSHDIYVELLGKDHPHSVATQLWVDQLSTPQPPPRSRCRRLPDGVTRVLTPERGFSPEPPLIEDSAEGAEDEEEEEEEAVGGGGVGEVVVEVDMAAPPLPGEPQVCC